MPRIARVVAVGYPHHITQRGNYRQKIFSEDADYKKYISTLKEESEQYNLIILAYCLMPNHVHVIGIPEKEDSLAKVFKYAHMKYSQYYNKKMRTSGHLFQGRFFSSAMDEVYTLACARYVERNPVRAKIVKKPCQYDWSSAKAHCEIGQPDKLGVNKLFNYIEEEQKIWRDFIETPDSAGEMKIIRDSTRNGRPVGTNSFVGKLEANLGRFLKQKSKGRPKKEEKKVSVPI